MRLKTCPWGVRPSRKPLLVKKRSIAVSLVKAFLRASQTGGSVPHHPDCRCHCCYHSTPAIPAPQCKVVLSACADNNTHCDCAGPPRCVPVVRKMNRFACVVRLMFLIKE